MNKSGNSLSIANPDNSTLDGIQKVGLALASTGILLLLISWAGVRLPSTAFLSVSLISILTGTALYAVRMYKKIPAGVHNNGVWTSSLTGRGAAAWVTGIVLTGFYVALYWFPQHLGLAENGGENRGLVALFDPLSRFFKGQPASQWFVYGTLYTLAIIAMGYKFLLKYRNNRYQQIRTFAVMVSQLFFAYLIPEIMEGLNTEKAYFAKDLKNIWPLHYYFFDNWHLDNMRQGGSLGMFFLIWGIILSVLLTPVITYFAGKRWYCSWVCGCGGLAETAGDPFRHLSSKKLSAWKIERWMIHSVLVFIVVVTTVVLYGYFKNVDSIFGLSIYTYFNQPYGFLIGAMFSGVIGVGFYPLLGNRVWCRFGCPLAAYMGIIQRFKSRFRITTNGGQCISCGNCSTYCEQGIDVRAYAQKGQNIVRASCVGCGICTAVCPRGVLKLENGPETERIKSEPVLTGNNIN